MARYFEEEDRFIEAVKRGEAGLERDEFLTHEHMADRLSSFKSRGLGRAYLSHMWKSRLPACLCYCQTGSPS